MAENKDTTENCYLVWGEDGHLTCIFNHKAGDDCLMKTNPAL